MEIMANYYSISQIINEAISVALKDKKYTANEFYYFRIGRILHIAHEIISKSSNTSEEQERLWNALYQIQDILSIGINDEYVVEDEE